MRWQPRVELAKPLFLLPAFTVACHGMP